MITNLNIIRDYAILCHESTNHKYDGKSYFIHLQMVVDVAKRHIGLVQPLPFIVIAACWCHDVIEDCRQTYNDVKGIAGEDVADIVYAVTNEKGKTRKERANKKYYDGIANTPFATFVKLCDRIANVQYSKETGSKMFKMYKEENRDFLYFLTEKHHYMPLVDELNDLFESVEIKKAG